MNHLLANRPAMHNLARMCVVILCVCFSAFAQEKVKIGVENNTVLVPVQINHNQFNFLLDTGSEFSAIDSSIASQIGLVGTRDVAVLKDYRDQTSEIVEVEALSIGTHHFSHQKLGTTQLDSVSAGLGVQVDGVLGNDILIQFPFRLNYSKGEMVIGVTVTNKTGTPVALNRSGDQFYVPLRMGSVPVELLLDTGTNSTNLSWETWRRISKVWQPDSVIDGVVRAGFPTTPAFFVCLPDVSAGNTILNDQVVRVQRQVNAGAFSVPGFAGILGSEFLRQFEVTFDLEHNQIFIKKDSQYRRDPYRYTTIGVQFAKDSSGEYAVMGVWKKSPAEEAGIRVGDLIEKINGESARGLGLEQFASQLHGEEGTPVRLVMKRNSVSSTMTLHTRQMLCSRRNVQDMLRASQK